MIVANFTTFRYVFSVTKVADVHGYEVWPTAKLRSGGFASLTLPTSLTFTLPFTLTCNGGAADSVPTSDEYDWYLSQRTDDPAAQLLSLTKPTGYSGSAVLDRTALGLSKFPDLSDTSRRGLLLRTAIYVQRRSDQAIQWADLHAAVVGTPGV
jgi:hypothetical protein